MKILILCICTSVVTACAAIVVSGDQSDSPKVLRAARFILVDEDGEDAVRIEVRGNRLVVLTEFETQWQEAVIFDYSKHQLQIAKEHDSAAISPTSITVSRGGQTEGDSASYSTLSCSDLSFDHKSKGDHEWIRRAWLACDASGNGLYLYDDAGEIIVTLEATRSDEGKGPWMSWLSMGERKEEARLHMGAQQNGRLGLSFFDANRRLVATYGPPEKKD